MGEMRRLGFLTANAAIFFIVLLSIPLALSLSIYHTYTSHTNYDLLLGEGVDAEELARSKVLLEGGGSLGIALVFLSFYMLNGCMYPESYRGLKLASRGYWIYLAGLTFCSLPWLFALFGVFLSDHFPLFLGRQDFEGFPAVHLGVHHSLYGFLACATIPVGFKIVSRFRFKPLKGLFGLGMFVGYVAGFYLFLQDFVCEQFFKRGFVPWLPSPESLYPILVVIGIACWIYWLRKTWPKSMRKFLSRLKKSCLRREDKRASE